MATPLMIMSLKSSIRISAKLEPVPFKRVLANGKRRFNDSRYTEYKEALGFLAKQAMKGKAPFAGAIKLTVKVFRNLKPETLPFGDIDNHLKAIGDALNGICYEDDRQIVKAQIELAKGEDKIQIKVEEIK